MHLHKSCCRFSEPVNLLHYLDPLSNATSLYKPLVPAPHAAVPFASFLASAGSPSTFIAATAAEGAADAEQTSLPLPPTSLTHAGRGDKGDDALPSAASLGCRSPLETNMRLRVNRSAPARALRTRNSRWSCRDGRPGRNGTGRCGKEVTGCYWEHGGRGGYS